MTQSWEDAALAALREHQEAAGMVFAQPDAPVAPMHPQHAADEEFR